MEYECWLIFERSVHVRSAITTEYVFNTLYTNDYHCGASRRFNFRKSTAKKRYKYELKNLQKKKNVKNC